MNTPLPRPRSSARTHSSPSHPPSSSTVPPATTAPAQGATVGSSEWLSGAIIEGHYQVGSLIGRGGMSEVYYALDLWSNNPVALKILSPALAQDAANRQKFHREERSMRQVGGGHTVGVISSGTEYVAGQMVMYIVLEYVHGCTLSQLLRTRRALSLGEALEVLLPVVDALSEVHANRYLHGDIKPGNILLDANGQVKLTDFGLSRRDDQVDSGAPMGTPAYVAPEVLDPQVKVGAQADIFALGVMMYRMLAGRLPFVGLENDQQVLYHNANIEMPPLGDIAPGIDRDMAGIIAWCTRKQPQARPKDATELFASLKEVSESLGESELSWRAPSVPEPTSSLWEAVADIAERSGAGQMVRNTPISAFSDAGDLLAYDVYSPDSLLIGSQDGVHLADVDAEDSVLNPEGIPPLKSSAPETSVAADAAESSESDDSRESEDLKSSGTSPVASDAPAGGAASMPSVSGGGPVGIGPQTEQEFISTFGEYAPIHAERAFNAYPDYPGSTESLGEAYTAEGSQRDSGGSTGSEASKFALREATHRDRRLPVRELAPPPSGIAMGVWALLVILLGMSASFGGWWLATSILQSEWWKNFTSFFGLGY